MVKLHRNRAHPMLPKLALMEQGMNSPPPPRCIHPLHLLTGPVTTHNLPPPLNPCLGSNPVQMELLVMLVMMVRKPRIVILHMIPVRVANRSASV